MLPVGRWPGSLDGRFLLLSTPRKGPIASLAPVLCGPLPVSDDEQPVLAGVCWHPSKPQTRARIARDDRRIEMLPSLDEAWREREADERGHRETSAGTSRIAAIALFALCSGSTASAEAMEGRR